MAAQLVQYKLFWDFEKEERWLEEMSAAGWHLKKISWFSYTFEQGAPEARIYKIDFRILKKKDEIDDYLAMFADSGWTCAAPRVGGCNFYFWAPRLGAGRDIFSDKASKAQRSLRYASYMGYCLWISMLPYLVLYLSGAFHVSEVGYQTPGLWSMPPERFVPHFLFETPFVVLRVGSAFFPIVPLAIGGYFFLCYYQQYRKVLAS